MDYLNKMPFMSEETDISADNDGEVAELQEEQISEDIESQDTNMEEQPQNQPEEITQTQAFARRLKEEKQKAIDAEYSRLYGSEYGIHSKSEYDAYVERQNLIEQGKDPELYNLKNEVESLKREKTLISQDKKLSNDAVYGDMYKELKPEIEQFVENNPMVDYETAFTILYKQKAPSIINELKQKIATIEGNQKNAQSSMGSLTGQGSVPSGFISKDTFERNKGNAKWVSDNLPNLRTSMKKW
jgi:hypothetical protein